MRNVSPEPWLIQRLKRQTTDKPLAECRFGEVWGLDYMGSAEYEFGAFARFLRRMAAASLVKFSATVEGVKVFGVYDPTAYGTTENVVDILTAIAKREVRHKESPGFPRENYTYLDRNRKKAYLYEKVSGWADIENGLFWTTESMSDAVLAMFQNSLKYMNEQTA